VLIGGNSRHYTFRTGDAERLARELLTFAAMHRAGLAVSVSPRTGPAAIDVLRHRLDGRPRVNFWDGNGENPYLGYLGLADAIVVTADSVSMISEACSTGKPVYVASLAGRGAHNIRNFYSDFTAAGLIRPFDGTLDRWRYTPLNEAARTAAEVRRRLPILCRHGGARE
jgi:mitochondrial fission protein ELM1